MKYSLTGNTNSSKLDAIIFFLTSHFFPTQVMEYTQKPLFIL